MSSRPKVLLTDRIHPDIKPMLEAECEVIVSPDTTAATINRHVGDVDAIIVRNKLAPDVFDHAKQLRACVRHGVGLDMVPVEAATARGIPVANLPGSNTTAVVEYALACMLHLFRGVATLDTSLRSAGWMPTRPLADAGRELRGSTLGVVGVGAIGARTAEIARAMGMRTIGLTRRPETLPAGVQAADKATLFAQSDVVLLACPLNEQTRGLVDAQTLALMKPDAVIINVSRGAVVQTEPLLGALKAGRLGGAALDVHETQPLPADAASFDTPNLLLTPHIAGTTATSLYGMSKGAVETTLALLRGERPANVVNPEVFKT